MSGPLRRFDPPANWDDFENPARRKAFRERWSQIVDGLTGEETQGFYNPLKTGVGNAQPAAVQWNAFPQFLEDERDQRKAWEQADQRPGSGGSQGEYCEWTVTRDADGKITRVTFTTELPEYWEALWEIRPERVVELYTALLGTAVSRSDLEQDGRYNRENRWNLAGGVHMLVGINTLSAGIGVVRSGTESGGTGRPASGFGFHADPMIINSVRRLVELSLRVSLSNPVGVYIGTPQFNRFELPPNAPRGARPEQFWRIVRGQADLALRAVYEVPEGHPFKVGDIKVDGQPVAFGSQIARTLQSGTFVTPIPR